jgi:hypothetical protein
MWVATAKAKKHIRLLNVTILEDSIITITEGSQSDYCLWARDGVYALPKEYVNEKSIKVISK